MPGNNRNRRNNRNRKKRKQYGFYFDYTLLFVLVFIVGFGLTMIYSTSSYTAQIEEGDPEFYFRKQLIFTIIGFALMIVETKILDYHYLKKLAVVIYIGGLLCMFLLKTPLGITRNGATRWIKIPGLGQFQPAELVKNFRAMRGDTPEKPKKNRTYVRYAVASFAALFVKVIAKIFHGKIFFSPIKYAILCVRTFVFPLPAPAITKHGPSVFTTASYCLSFNPFNISSIISSFTSRDTH